MTALQSKAGWKWYGFPGHYICADRCKYHLCTSIAGKYLVSTVGLFVIDPLNNPDGIEEVGVGRLFETMVFGMDGEDEFGNPNRESDSLECVGYNDSMDAERGHYAMCEKYAAEVTAA